MTDNPTRRKVVEAASLLFFQHGFDGTSVRDIAEKAAVNVSLISYYFKSKQGLLEHAVTQYYEAYLETIEESQLDSEGREPLENFKILIRSIIQYKQRYYQLSCFIQRELSLDSVFVREMTVTYLAKENYIISRVFNAILSKNTGNHQNNQFLLLQLKGMLITPYLMQYEWKDRIAGEYSHKQFAWNYTKMIEKWIDFVVEQSYYPA